MLLAKPLLLSRGYDVHTIFLTPPNLQTLRDRLALRPGITEDEIEHRLKSIAYEMEISQQYDTIFINDLLDDCVREVAQYIRSKLS
jgi:guanylate kinase